MKSKGIKAIMLRSVLQIVRRPLYWVGFFILPLFLFLFFTSLMEQGLPTRVPAAIVDKDGTSVSREITQNLGGMQMVDLVDDCNSFSEARHKMQEGKIFGYFFIPENFQADLLAGRKPGITFYTNMTYFVPASLLFKTFKTTALYAKAGIAMNVLESAGAASLGPMSGMLLPVNVNARPLGNPQLNYAIYLGNTFVPCALQVMILLITCFSLGQEVKYRTSRTLMEMADGSIVKALFAKLLPQTVIWLVIVIFMESWLYGWNGYPMRGSWFWFTLSEVMFVLAAQATGVFFFGVIPNLRLSLSVSALLGILCFSLAALSFPVESMYGSISIFSWILPFRYNLLIYVDQALNGIPVYFSRFWYIAYIVFMVLPLPFLPRIRKAFMKPVYIP